jgi:hypothetical protein
MSQRAIDWFGQKVNKEIGAIRFDHVSSNPLKKIVTANITLDHDFLADKKDLNPDPKVNQTLKLSTLLTNYFH